MTKQKNNQMKTVKKFTAIALIVTTMGTFLNCASSQNLVKSAPLEIGEVYYQKWVAGTEAGGTGINVYIPVESNTIPLDSIYFRGKKAKLELKNDGLYVGHFKSDANQKKDMVMSSDRLAEYNNPIPKIPEKIPFELKENECVVSFKEAHKIKYYKISNITKKDAQFFPSTPPRR